MATIAPGRLLDVSNAADFVALSETRPGERAAKAGSIPLCGPSGEYLTAQ